jgi:FkbM family methyltransferase
MGRSLTSRMVSTVKHTTVYSRLKNSCVQDLWWGLRKPELIEAGRKQVEFYRQLLRGFHKGDLIFDIGANVGEKTNAFVRFGATVVAVEPDLQNQEILRGKFIKYRLSRKPVWVVGKAVSDQISVATMWIDGPGSALNTLSQKWADALRGNKERFSQTPDVLEFAEKRSVETTTLEQLIAEYGLPFFVKIDVEGHELSVLRGLRRPVRYLSYEINLPEFRQEGLECLNLLRDLVPEGEFNYTSDINCGLALERWAKPQEFARIVSDCGEGAIEVFWRSSPPPVGPEPLHNGGRQKERD